MALEQICQCSVYWGVQATEFWCQEQAPLFLFPWLFVTLQGPSGAISPYPYAHVSGRGGKEGAKGLIAEQLCRGLPVWPHHAMAQFLPVKWLTALPYLPGQGAGWEDKNSDSHKVQSYYNHPSRETVSFSM